MAIGSIIAVYFIVWWICLFAVLPFGVRSQAEDQSIVPGSEPGAPTRSRMWTKVGVTSVLAAIVTPLLLWGLSNPLLQQYWR